MDDAQRVKAAIDLVAYIGRFVQLKKTGRNYLGLCPFHGENTPSFNISPERSIYKCFGCQASGDVINFVMQREGLDFSEALKLLAGEAGITLSHTTTKNRDQENALYALLESSADFFHRILLTHPQAQSAREYLHRRGFSSNDQGSEIIKSFKLGFALDSWQALKNHLRQAGFTPIQMQAAGVLTVKDNRSYDTFRNRVIFPLVNRVGRIVGFSGRVLDDTKPKYINTAETPIFHKREFLFGFYQAREAIRKNDSIIIVEGEMDMLSSYRVGVCNVAAVKGSSLTPEHIKYIKHLTSNIKLCFDSDKAGDLAQIKAINDAINAGCNVEVVSLPQGKDADECIRHNPQTWLEAVAHTTPFYDFLISSHLHSFGSDSPQAKSQIVQSLKPHLLSLSDPTVQAHYITKLAHTVSLEVQQVQKILNSTQKIHQKSQNISENQEISSIKPSEITAEHHLIAMLVSDPQLIKHALPILPEHAIHDTQLRLLYNTLAQYTSVREAQPLKEHLAHIVQEQQAQSLLDTLYTISVPAEPELLIREIRVASLHLARHWLHKALDQVAKQLKKADTLQDTELKNKMNALYLKLVKQKGDLEAFAKNI